MNYYWINHHTGERVTRADHGHIGKLGPALGVFRWAQTIEVAHARCRQYALIPAAVDDDGARYTGDEFWDKAGDWDWRTENVGQTFA